MFKPQFLAITIAITGASLTGASLAQEQDGEQVERKKPPHAQHRDHRVRHDRHVAKRLLQRMDTNDDELISLEEYIGDGITRYSQTFTRIDKNDDGYITAEELLSSRKDRPRNDSEALQACLEAAGVATGTHDERLHAADSNGDGALSQDEFFAMLEQGAQDRFNHMDSDGDQQLTKEEIQASNQERNDTRKAVRLCMKEQRDLAQ